MSKFLKNSKSYILCLMLFAAMTLAIGCSKTDASTKVNDTNTVLENSELGEGETQFTFVVVDMDGKETNFTINTNEKTVGAALVSLNLISGDESDYGLYVKTVNGLTVDWDKDQKYWAFYIDGEYAMTGVDSTDIVPGSTYTFKVE